MKNFSLGKLGQNQKLSNAAGKYPLLRLVLPGTVVSVVNSYAATSEYTPARFDNKVDFPTDGKPTNPMRASPV